VTVFAGEIITASGINGSLPMMVRKAADENAPTSAAAVQDDDVLVLNVEANTTYFVTAWLRYTAASNTPDLRVGYSFPAGATFVRNDYGPPSATTTASDTTDWTTASGTTENGRGAGTGERGLLVIGELIVGGTAGTFKVRFGQVTSSVDVVTMKAGSRLVLQKYA
jgi:hypothetical protein